jgi:hypothetical protein
MRYYVVHGPGQRFGPADVDLLNVWAEDGRIDRESVLEEADTGRRLAPTEVLGLRLPEPVAWTPPPPAAPAPPSYASYPRQMPASVEGSSDLTISWVASAVGIGFGCFLVGPLVGLVYANKAMEKRVPGANAARIFAYVVLGLHLFIVLAYCGLGMLMMGLGGW